MRGLLDNRHEIELAEGISVHLRPASLVPRVIARTVDITLQSLIMTICSVILLFLGKFIGWEFVQGLILLLGFVVYWFYDLFFELAQKASTPGKRMMKLKVVKLSGAPTDFASSFLRALLLPIDYLPFGLAGMVSSMASKHSQRLGDLAAGTLVVYTVGETVEECLPVPVPAVRPSVPLKREEQLAFLEFGRRYADLSAHRQNEIVECLTPIKGSATSELHYALGVNNWLKEREM